MASNALSQRRKHKPRPEVCDTHRNPGRCEPPPPPPPPEGISCSLSPETDLDIPGNTIELQAVACNLNLPEEDPVTAVLDGDGADFSLNDDIVNCVDVDAVVESDEEGVFNVSAVFTFSDGSTCTATGVYTFEEEE